MTPVLAPAVPAPPLATPKPAAPAPALPGLRLLAVTEQITRRPLDAWAAELEGDIAAALAMEEGVERARTVTGCGNNASLILAHAGRLDDAERIVRAQIEWLHAEAARTGRGALRALAMQPWINLGRLEALRGRPDDALRHYHDVRACRMDRPVTLAGAAVLPADWAAAGWEPEELERFGRSVLVIDGLRVLLPAGRWALVREMADDGELGQGAAAPFLREAGWVALGREGRPREALERLESTLRSGGPWDRMAAHVRLAELSLLAGDQARAASVTGELVAVVGQMSGVEGLQLPALLIVQALVALALAHAPSAAALALAGRVAAGARRLDDEVMEIEALRLLAAHAPDPHAAELRRREDATGYARLRPRGRPAPPSMALDALLERMLAALRTD